MTEITEAQTSRLGQNLVAAVCVPELTEHIGTVFNVPLTGCVALGRDKGASAAIFEIEGYRASLWIVTTVSVEAGRAGMLVSPFLFFPVAGERKELDAMFNSEEWSLGELLPTLNALADEFLLEMEPASRA